MFRIWATDLKTYFRILEATRVIINSHVSALLRHCSTLEPNLSFRSKNFDGLAMWRHLNSYCLPLWVILSVAMFCSKATLTGLIFNSLFHLWRGYFTCIWCHCTKKWGLKQTTVKQNPFNNSLPRWFPFQSTVVKTTVNHYRRQCPGRQGCAPVVVLVWPVLVLTEQCSA